MSDMNYYGEDESPGDHHRRVGRLVDFLDNEGEEIGAELPMDCVEEVEGYGTDATKITLTVYVGDGDWLSITSDE